MPLGDTVSQKVDVRIIAATNKDLKDLLHQGVIREDFFYRIRVIVITLPPLRDRKEDIPLLTEYFLEQYSAANKRPPIPGRIMDSLCTYHWPGNVRELQNELQRYLVEGRLEFIGNEFVEQDKGPDLEFVQQGLSFRETIEAYEKRLIARALAQNAGHQGKTAKMLDISEKTLYNKMRKYGVKSEK
jgi:transcriptional regulator with PAS, ATPase and Fis domain